jgi:hypothetical protein
VRKGEESRMTPRFSLDQLEGWSCHFTRMGSERGTDYKYRVGKGKAGPEKLV